MTAFRPNRESADEVADRADLPDSDSSSGTSPTSAFNARSLSAREVASFFVPPPAFEILMRGDHSLLSGPRGSGKTTLLKMLQPEALEAWSHPKADSARAAIGFIGVFVPTDRTWNAQLILPAPAALQEELERIADATFTAHTLRCLISSMRGAARDDPTSPIGQKWRVALAPASEQAFVRQIVEQWSLPVEVAALDYVGRALSQRIATLGRIRRSLLRNTPGSADLPDWTDLDCLEEVASAVREFNGAVDEPDRRWALLFDELELAPTALVERLLGALRSSDPRLLFKLSLSPFHEELSVLRGPQSPVHGQDYEYIPLTYARKLGAQEFARAFFAEQLRYLGLPELKPEEILGQARFDLSDGEGVSPTDTRPTKRGFSRKKVIEDPYSPEGDLGKKYVALRDSDPSFREYLEQHKIDLHHLERLTATQRAAHIRKVRNLVIVREYFRREASAGGTRSRKSYELYVGADAIFALVDGNPRQFVTVIRRLLRDWHPTSPIPVEQQSAAISGAIERYLAFLKALPAVEMANGRRLTVMGLMDTVGRAMHNRIVREPFKDNVPGAFRVDVGLEDEYITCIGRAVNAGALVHVPKKDGSRLQDNLRGEVFRLTYLLAPHYHLPLRLGPPVSLSALLPSTAPSEQSGSGASADYSGGGYAVGTLFSADWWRSGDGGRE